MQIELALVPSEFNAADPFSRFTSATPLQCALLALPRSLSFSITRASPPLQRFWWASSPFGFPKLFVVILAHSYSDQKQRFPKESAGVAWVQSILEAEESRSGKKSAKRLRALVVPSRDAPTLHTNILETVSPGVTVQTDGWAAYQGLKNVQHESVNHSESWVVHNGRGKITTNTVEGTHSSLRRISRKMNLFYGCPSEMLQKRVDELVFRFNHRREKSDMFPLFLHLLLFKYPCIPHESLELLFAKLHL